MLNKLDDYPIHQTPEPVAHTLGGDRNAYDRYWFNGFTREADLFFAVALGVYPNRRVMDAAVSVVCGGLQYVVRGSRLAPDERTDTRAGPISIEVVEPMRALRVRIAPNPHGLAGELVFRARTEALEEPRLTLRQGARVGMDSTRFTQFGAWEGWLEVGAERIKLDASHVLGTRDRSWGLRPVGERETTGAPAPAPQFFWLWAPLHFDDRCAHFQINEDAEGRVLSSHGALVPLLESGQPIEEMASVRHSVKWEKGTRRASAADLELVRARGEPERLALEPLLAFQMRGIGYTDPEWGHGMWKGEDVTSGALWRLAEIDPMEPWHVHVQQLCRVRAGARWGYGVLEQLVIGPHAPSGFQSLLDPAG
ncbi:MAG: hypothetical protein FJ108_11740 [Deltaproteobacteria bacterium]|nr:hypothetical protein [Deltaproteobacteria bacterium]